jgi:cytochrome b561
MSSKIEQSAITATKVAAGDDRTRYDDFAMILHWLTALLVFAQFALAELWDLVPRQPKILMIASHMSFGIILSVVVIVRLVWRVLPDHRVRPAVTGWVELASKAVHYLLYALLIVEAGLGFLERWSGGAAMSFFGLSILPFFPPFSKSARHLVGDAHNYVGWAIIVVAVGHAAAALYHHFILRDNLLWRMLPGARASSQEPRMPSPEQAAS